MSINNFTLGLGKLLSLHRRFIQTLSAFLHRLINRILEHFLATQNLLKRSNGIHIWLYLPLFDDIRLIYGRVVDGVILLELNRDVDIVSLWVLLLFLAILLHVRRYLSLLCRSVDYGFHVYVLMRLLLDVVLFDFAGSQRWRGRFNFVLGRFQSLFLRGNFTGLID